MRIILAVAIAAVGTLMSAQAAYMQNDGYYVFDVAESETCSTVLSGANGVKKLGSGTLILTAENTFTGPLVISNGTVQVAQGKFLGSPSKVVIAPLGVLDVQETVNTYSVGANDPIFPESTRMEVAGKIVRNGGFPRNYTFKNFRLTGDAELSALGSKATGVGGNGTDAGIYLQGHTLKISSSGANLQFGLNGILDPNAGRESDGDFGSVEQTSGEATIQGLASIVGDSNNVWSVTGGSTITFWNTRQVFPWTLNAIGNGVLRAGAGNLNCWSGPVTVSDGSKLSVKLNQSSTGAKLKVSGPVKVEGSGELDVVMTAVNGNVIAFTDRVEGFGQSKVSVYANSDSLVAFSNNFTLATDASFAKAQPGTAEFAGLTNEFGKAVDGVEGTLRFNGCDLVRFNKNLITSPKASADVEFADVGYVRLGANIYLRGPGTDPSHLTMTNVTIGQVNTAAKVYIPDQNGNAAYADVFANSLITNCFLIGGNMTNMASMTKGALRQWGGVVELNQFNDTILGQNPGNYGYFALNGGETRQGGTKNFLVGQGGTAFCEVRGGAFNAYRVHILEKGGYGQLRMTGGELNANMIRLGNTPIAQASQEYVGQGVLALSGSDTSMTLSDRVQVSMASSADFSIAVNEGARLGALRIGRDYTGVDRGHVHISVNGGVLTHNGTTAGDWYNGTSYSPESFIVHDGGVVFEPKMTGNATNNFAVMSSDLTAPDGYVVTAVALPTAAEFADEHYMGPVQVKISGDGTGAVACVDYDDALMLPTNITVVAKGTGYAANGTTAQMASADGKTWYDCEVTVAPAPSTGMGLVKRGDQKLELTGENTYKGDTRVDGGTLKLTGSRSLPEGSGLAVASGATVDLNNVRRTVPTLEGAGTVNGSVEVTDRLTATCGLTPLTVTGTLTFGSGLTLTVTNQENLDPERVNVLVTANELEGPMPVATGLDRHWRISMRGNRLCAVRGSPFVIIVR